MLAAMQSEAGQAIYGEAGLDPSDPESLVVVTDQGLLRNSEAVLYIYRHLGWPWRAASIFSLVRRALRDPIYLLIARNRCPLFGKHQQCWLPGASDHQRPL